MRFGACATVAALLWACKGPPPGLPSAPANFSAVFGGGDVAELSWDAVPGATGYLLYVYDGSAVLRLESTLGTQYNFLPAFEHVGSTHFAFAVRATSPNGTSPFSDQIKWPYPAPQAMIDAAETTATIQWPTSPGAATIAISTSLTGSPEIVRASTSPWQRSSLDPGGTYYWRVTFGSPPVSFQTTGYTHLAPLPSEPRLTYSGGQFALSWPAVAGATGYKIRATSDGVATTTQQGTTTFGPTTCAGGATCIFEIATVSDTNCVSVWSAPLQVTNPPDAPPAPTVQSGVNEIAVSLAVLPRFADHLKVYRSDTLGAQPVEIGSTASGSATFKDSTALPWQNHFYVVRAVTADGVESFQSPESPLVYAVNAPAASNYGSGGIDVDQSEGERFTIPGGGRLMGIEVALTAPTGSVRLELSAAGNQLFRKDAVVQPAPTLLPDGITATYFDLSAASLYVSTGEVLQFDVVGPDGVDVSAGIGPATAGGHVRHGSPDSAHDLAYKVFVDPGTALSAPTISESQGIGAVRLDWPAIPGADHYEVDRALGNGTFSSIGTTQQPWFLDDGGAVGVSYFYQVQAVAADGRAAVGSGPFPLGSSSEMTAAESLGSTSGASVRLCAPGSLTTGVGLLDQTFTVTEGTKLEAIEVRLEGPLSADPGTPYDLPFDLSFQVLDAGGAPLAAVQTVQVMPVVPSPLMPRVRVAQAYLNPLNIAVAAGDLLTLRLTHPAGDRAPCVLIRDSADAYGGGTEIRDGVIQPGRSLAFRATTR